MAWDGTITVFGKQQQLDLPKKDLAAIQSLLEEVHFEPGEVVMAEGDAAREAYWVREGTLKVTLKRRKLAEIGPGAIVGEMSLLDDQVRSATVTAVGPVRAYAIPRSGFAKVLDRPAIWRMVAGLLTQRLRDINGISKTA